MVKHQPEDMAAFIFEAFGRNGDLRASVLDGRLSVEEAAARMLRDYGLLTGKAVAEKAIRDYLDYIRSR